MVDLMVDGAIINPFTIIKPLFTIITNYWWQKSSKLASPKVNWHWRKRATIFMKDVAISLASGGQSDNLKALQIPDNLPEGMQK